MLRALLAAAMIAVVVSPAVQADARQLSGDEIRNKIAGKRVFLAVPLGGEFPLFYQTSGRVDGSGDAVGLGRYMAPTDSGRWWIMGDRLCQQWRSWYNGREFCFTISSTTPGRITWRRDDGFSGSARVGQ